MTKLKKEILIQKKQRERKGPKSTYINTLTP
jgi:hypothetical protein